MGHELEADAVATEQVSDPSLDVVEQELAAVLVDGEGVGLELPDVGFELGVDLIERDVAVDRDEAADPVDDDVHAACAGVSGRDR